MHTTSAHFTSLAAKIEFLERYVTFRRHYLDLDFVIDYQNNSGGLIPGPSDWNIVVAAVVPEEDLNQ